VRYVFFGAHPDDPESCAGGTMFRLAEAGHEVISLYLTLGEYGVMGMSDDECGKLRTGEAERACKVLGCRPVFVGGQLDAREEVTPQGV